MKVKELIKKLEKLDIEADIYLDDSSIGYKDIQEVLIDDEGDGLIV